MNAKEAALLVTGFKDVESVDILRSKIEKGDTSLNDLVSSRAELMEKIEEAELIQNELCREAGLCLEAHPNKADSGLEIDSDMRTFGGGLPLTGIFLKSNAPKVKFTKSSLAFWFFAKLEIFKARLLIPGYGLDGMVPSNDARLLIDESELRGELKMLNERNTELLAENEMLKASLHNKEAMQLDDDELLVKGKDMKILSEAIHNFPTRFQHYKTRTYPKHQIMTWLDSSYGCTSRQQFVFADILRDYFPAE